MSLEDLAKAAEPIGAMGVVLSLVYLAVHGIVFTASICHYDLLYSHYRAGRRSDLTRMDDPQI